MKSASGWRSGGKDMAILDMDFGNTRLKWRVSRKGDVLADGALAVPGNDGSQEWLAGLIAAVDATPVRVRAASVRDNGINQALAAAVSAHWGVEVEFARTGRTQAGVTSAYQQPRQMGVDRWLGMLAAFDRVKGPCCVVSAGSALTVDLVGAGGQHIGGYIVPGMGMMLDALQNRSRALTLAAEPTWDSVLPGSDTRQCMEHGVLSLVTGWLLNLCQEREPGKVILSGGDGARLQPWLPGAILVSGLVLDGLAIALP